MSKKNYQSTTEQSKSAAHVDWGLVAAIIAILQATTSSGNMYLAADHPAKQWVFGVGALMGALASIGAIAALYRKMKGGEPAPRIGTIMIFAIIFAAIIIAFLDPIYFAG